MNSGLHRYMLGKLLWTNKLALNMTFNIWGCFLAQVSFVALIHVAPFEEPRNPLSLAMISL